MSYDLRLFSPTGGASLESEGAAARLVELESISDEPRARDAIMDVWRERLSAALHEAVPTLEPLVFDYASIADVLDCTAEEARLRIRYEELDDARLGIQLTLFDNAATLTMAYASANDDETSGALRTLWTILEVCERVSALRAHDAQLNRVLDLKTDFDDVVSAYRKQS